MGSSIEWLTATIQQAPFLPRAHPPPIEPFASNRPTSKARLIDKAKVRVIHKVIQ
ncbi:UNVERIFIED_ORG: hypothetical protein ABIC54_003128 [Burkholderia sp. 1263]